MCCDASLFSLQPPSLLALSVQLSSVQTVKERKKRAAQNETQQHTISWMLETSRSGGRCWNQESSASPPFPIHKFFQSKKQNLVCVCWYFAFFFLQLLWVSASLFKECNLAISISACTVTIQESLVGTKTCVHFFFSF